MIQPGNGNVKVRATQRRQFVSRCPVAKRLVLWYNKTDSAVEKNEQSTAAAVLCYPMSIKEHPLRTPKSGGWYVFCYRGCI